MCTCIGNICTVCLLWRTYFNMNRYGCKFLGSMNHPTTWNTWNIMIKYDLTYQHIVYAMIIKRFYAYVILSDVISSILLRKRTFWTWTSPLWKGKKHLAPNLHSWYSIVYMYIFWHGNTTTCLRWSSEKPESSPTFQQSTPRNQTGVSRIMFSWKAKGTQCHPPKKGRLGECLRDHGA